jgi:hypothetical protein
MSDINYCDHCEGEAEVTLAAPGGETKYLCTAPECMMAAGLCPNCHVDLEIKVADSGEEIYHCVQCDFEQTYEDLGQA